MNPIEFRERTVHFTAFHDCEDWELRFSTYLMDGLRQVDVRWYERVPAPNGGKIWVPTRRGIRVPYDMLSTLLLGLQSIPMDLADERREDPGRQALGSQRENQGNTDPAAPCAGA